MSSDNLADRLRIVLDALDASKAEIREVIKLIAEYEEGKPDDDAPQ